MRSRGSSATERRDPSCAALPRCASVIAMSSLRSRESALIVAIQQTALSRALIPVARVLSLWGEHAAGWLISGALAAVTDPSRSWAWVLCDAAILLAHGLSIVLKRLVRRPRPKGAGVTVHSSAPSALSFPSSHASSTTAAAVLFTAMVAALWPLAVIVVVGMLASRLALGMHFPSDVIAGTLLGALTAAPFIPLLSAVSS
ncbi:phosphatase PAP2 family protein [Rathayibacter toxicus]|uniref:phosphatase PAP2 family protein n=1 Tax=Rathayibacter toxicus TaxID=145458 RepID=UPI001C0466FA|nr:phosphatase PAP2 family protein [Rathayibacter toxicus]